MKSEDFFEVYSFVISQMGLKMTDVSNYTWESSWQ